VIATGPDMGNETLLGFRLLCLEWRTGQIDRHARGEA